MIDQLQKYINLIKELSKQRFFGKLTLQFENGTIVIARKEETVKL